MKEECTKPETGGNTTNLTGKSIKKCLKAKSEWMTEKCEEIEQRMYSKIKEIKGRKQKYKNNISMKKADSTVAMEMDKVKERWNDYMQQLFRDQKPETLNLSPKDDGPTILKNEVKCAMRSMKKGKAVGEAGAGQEMILAMGEFSVNGQTNNFKKIYASGIIR